MAALELAEHEVEVVSTNAEVGPVLEQAVERQAEGHLGTSATVADSYSHLHHHSGGIHHRTRRQSVPIRSKMTSRIQKIHRNIFD